MANYVERPTRIGGSTSEGISPGRGKVRLRLAVSRESEREGVTLTLNNVYYLPSSPSNLISLALLNDNKIYLNNENETLYDSDTKEILASTQRWRKCFLLKLLNLSDAAVHLTRADKEIYQGPHVHQTVSTSSLPLTTWHKRLGHLNLVTLCKYLNELGILFVDDGKDHVCDSCQRAKATKIYNREPQERSQYPYQFIHTDLVGPITPTGFSGERYFFTFTDDCTRHTETYTGTKKSDWLECLKAFHNLAKTRTKNSRPTEKIRSDYGSELQSKKVDQWLSQEGIILEPSAPYLQEQNGVSERVGRTLMDMARASIIEGGIDDIFWPEVILAMTYIKNIRPTTALNGLSPHQKLFNSPPDPTHLRVLGSTIYVLIHEEERELKSEKFVLQAMKGTLVGFDGHTIYQVYIEEQSRVIRAKDLQIFEDTESKKDTVLPYYGKEPTFQGFLLDDNDDEKITSNTKASNEMPSNVTKDQSKSKTAEQQRKSRSGRTIKPSEKAKGQSL